MMNHITIVVYIESVKKSTIVGTYTKEAHLTLCLVVVVQIHVPTPSLVSSVVEHTTFNRRVTGSSPV